MNASDPRGLTLWEMFLGWLRRLFGGPPSPVAATPPFTNPLDWIPGVPVPLDATHGPEFTDALVRVELLRHSDRTIGGQSFPAVTYQLRVTARNGDVTKVRVHCVPSGPDRWDSLLLRLHDEFAYAGEFIEVLNDDTGTFTIEDDPSGQPVQFDRLNGVQGPWLAVAREFAGETGDITKAKPARKYEYWDYHRFLDGEAEEFLFVEIDGESGWTQLWRGGNFSL